MLVGDTWTLLIGIPEPRSTETSGLKPWPVTCTVFGPQCEPRGRLEVTDEGDVVGARDAVDLRHDRRVREDVEVALPLASGVTRFVAVLSYATYLPSELSCGPPTEACGRFEELRGARDLRQVRRTISHEHVLFAVRVAADQIRRERREGDARAIRTDRRVEAPVVRRRAVRPSTFRGEGSGAPIEDVHVDG